MTAAKEKAISEFGPSHRLRHRSGAATIILALLRFRRTAREIHSPERLPGSVERLDAWISRHIRCNNTARVVAVVAQPCAKEELGLVKGTEALGRTMDRLRTLGVLLIVSYRPEFEPPWIGRPYVIALTSRTGSSPLLKMIGIVLVAARAAGIDGLFAKITLTRRFTKSAASPGKRPYWLSAQRY
jgi:hypothetical protein